MAEMIENFESEAIAAIATGNFNLLPFIEKLGPFLTSTDVQLRIKGTKTLATILAQNFEIGQPASNIFHF